MPLMDWVYYHEVMTEFGIRHWVEAGSIDKFCKGPLAIRPGKIFVGSSMVSYLLSLLVVSTEIGTVTGFRWRYMPYGCP